jgi:hypothetical protein
VKSLDTLHQDQENHQRITTTIVGKIETENCRLISDSRNLLDSQKYRLLEDTLKDGDNRARALVADLAEDLQAQQRRLFEGFKDTEQIVRTLVVDLVEGMSAQQRRVIGMKRFIQQHGAGKEGY